MKLQNCHVKSDLKHTEFPFQTFQTSQVCFWEQLVDTVQRPMKLGNASVSKSTFTKFTLQVLTLTFPTKGIPFPLSCEKSESRIIKASRNSTG